MRIPARNRDLTRYVRRRYAVRIVLWMFWTTLLLVGALLYNQSHEISVLPRITGWRMAVWVLAAVGSGALLFHIPRLLWDRSFEGTIVRSGLSHSYSTSADPGAGQAVSYGFRLNTSLRVRTTDGKFRRIRFEQKPGFYLYYHEGNSICHIAGLPYPIADPARMVPVPRSPHSLDDDTTGNTVVNPAGSYLCAACGTFRRELTVCEHCGHSLINPKELFGEEKKTESP